MLFSFLNSWDYQNFANFVNGLIFWIIAKNEGENELYMQWHNVGNDLLVLDFGNINHCADVAAFDFGWLLLFDHNT